MTIILIILALILLGLVVRSYLFESKQARINQAKYASQIIPTDEGLVEYACSGNGPCLLFIHGAAGGYDQGITVGKEIFGPRFRLIAPSRFGYQHSTLPKDASPSSQADVYARLLDALNIKEVMVAGISAGAPSAMQFAIRYPQRVKALFLIVPLAYSPKPKEKRNVSLPFILSSLLKTDLPLWLATKLRPASVLYTIGVPFPIQEQMTSEMKQKMMRDMFPFRTRISGMMNDGKIANDMKPFNLEKINAPALVISAKDDPWKTYQPAHYSAGRIRAARFTGFNSGGHMLFGKGEKIRKEIAALLKRPQSPQKNKIQDDKDTFLPKMELKQNEKYTE